MKFLNWLISLFIHPLPDPNQAKLQKFEDDAKTLAQRFATERKVKEMSEPLNETSTGGLVQQSQTALPTANQQILGIDGANASPVQEAKTGVKDFEAALKFVESGVVQLGAAAKDELKALAVKYL